MSRRVAVLGGGGHGRVVTDCAFAAGWQEVQIFDDGETSTTGPWGICGSSAKLIERVAEFDGVIVGVGNNNTRLALSRRILEAGGKLSTICHPSAAVSRQARLGPGSVGFAGSVMNIGARTGLAAIINSGATVDHDCLLGDGVHISPGAHLAGGVIVGDLAWIGIGAVVREGVHIGERAIIGAGAVVVADVPRGYTVVGNPARLLRK